MHDCLSRVRSLDQRSLKQAYRRRAQETHPDRAHLRTIVAPDPEAEFRSVVAAYELLKLVQQGAVDVQVVSRAATAKPRHSTRQTHATTGFTGFKTATTNTHRKARAEQPRDRNSAQSTAGTGRKAHEQAQAERSYRRREQRDSSANYHDRAEQRAEAWGRFWQQTATSSKFNPWSDHYFEQQVPARQLPLGQFLYYSGAISWRQLIDALVWQRQQRPMIGQLARSWGLLTETQVQSVLEKRRQSGRYDTKFADFAEELGYLTAQDKAALCGRMKMMQKPLGQYFVDQGVFSREQLTEWLTAHRRHNWRAMQRRAKPW